MLLNTLYQEQYPIFYYARCLHSLKFFHNSSMLESVIQIWKNPDFQYSKLSFIRLSAFGPIYSNISNPTWLPELDQIWISLTTFPLGNHQLQFPLVQVSDAYCNVIYRLRVYSHVIELYFTIFLFLLTT
jgi:hypothetical protein